MTSLWKQQHKRRSNDFLFAINLFATKCPAEAAGHNFLSTWGDKCVAFKPELWFIPRRPFSIATVSPRTSKPHRCTQRQTPRRSQMLFPCRWVQTTRCLLFLSEWYSCHEEGGPTTQGHLLPLFLFVNGNAHKFTQCYVLRLICMCRCSIFVAHAKIKGLNPQTQPLFTIIMCLNISFLIEVVSSGILLPIYNI